MKKKGLVALIALVLICCSCGNDEIIENDVRNLEHTVWKNNDITLSFHENDSCIITHITEERVTTSQLKYDNLYIWSPLSRCFYIKYQVVSDNELLLVFDNQEEATLYKSDDRSYLFNN